MSGYNFRGRANSSKRRGHRDRKLKTYGIVGLGHNGHKLFRVKGGDYEQAKELFNTKYVGRGVIFVHNLGPGKRNELRYKFNNYYKRQVKKNV